ncbi:hypothetical protein B7H23_06380 [Notoacmeibacter marinus]|uniref:Methyl-accepting chemotaxis protein n=1 Tax=Notoacmeibacter marinus TaxID=1876515 RepID=A0A231V2W6_9HYPH|nr:methyl-accepting chemotaxis protein [Notoacmeibacter marinus]OXT02518.1 hypothetical protein B7H23_06380 [Notoacmeibacter marinus]
MLANIVGRYSLRFSLSALFAVLAVLASAVVGTVGYIQSAGEMRQSIARELGLIASNQAQLVNDYEQRLNEAITNMSGGAMVPNSLAELSIGFNVERKRQENIDTFRNSGATPEERAQFAGRNRNVSIYEWKHSEVHNSLFSYWKDLGLSDLYLIDDKGNIVYTVTKSEEFMQNLQASEFGSLNRFFQSIMAGEATSLSSKGFERFPVGGPSLILAHGVERKSTFGLAEGEVAPPMAVVAFRVSAIKFSEMFARQQLDPQSRSILMTDASGQVVASSDGRKRPEPLDLSALKPGDDGISHGLIEDTQGFGTSLAAASDVDFDGRTFHVITLYEQDAAMAGVSNMGLTMAGLTLAALILVSITGMIFSNIVARPINVLTEDMRRLADGDLQNAAYDYDLRNEIGSMASAVEIFREQALEKRRIEGETEQMRNRSESERAEREAVTAQDNEARRHALDTLGTALKSLSAGNISHRIAMPFAAEFDQLRLDYNEAAEKLADALYQAARSADSICLSSAEVSNAAGDLAKRTETQAASIEQSSDTLSQIASNASEVAGRTDQVQSIVNHAQKEAAESAEIVDRAMNAMREIEESSDEITQIVSVINEIAFQTNLLALNAGVEAARAGDAGKGFGVVAQEVRELAQRCGDAAGEIRGLITRSVEKVKSGSVLVSDTGDTLKRIVSEVADISEHVTAITLSMRSQSDGLSQVSSTMRMMDQETQKNAAIAEESTAGSQVLAGEAAALNRQLSQFDVSAAEEMASIADAA